jgi:hypothetical protein
MLERHKWRDAYMRWGATRSASPCLFYHPGRASADAGGGGCRKARRLGLASGRASFW